MLHLLIRKLKSDVKIKEKIGEIGSHSGNTSKVHFTCIKMFLCNLILCGTDSYQWEIKYLFLNVPGLGVQISCTKIVYS